MKACTHPKCQPHFDEAAAKALLAECKHPANQDPLDGMFGLCRECIGLVRQKWPRFWGECPDCGVSLIAYASAAHYTYGDW